VRVHPRSGFGAGLQKAEEQLLLEGDCITLFFGLVSRRTAGVEGIGAAAILLCSLVVEARRRRPWQY
jgi:hypothetical protein